MPAKMGALQNRSDQRCSGPSRSICRQTCSNVQRLKSGSPSPPGRKPRSGRNVQSAYAAASARGTTVRPRTHFLLQHTLACVARSCEAQQAHAPLGVALLAGRGRSGRERSAPARPVRPGGRAVALAEGPAPARARGPLLPLLRGARHRGARGGRQVRRDLPRPRPARPPAAGRRAGGELRVRQHRVAGDVRLRRSGLRLQRGPRGAARRRSGRAAQRAVAAHRRSLQEGALRVPQEEGQGGLPARRPREAAQLLAGGASSRRDAAGGASLRCRGMEARAAGPVGPPAVAPRAVRLADARRRGARGTRAGQHRGRAPDHRARPVRAARAGLGARAGWHAARRQPRLLRRDRGRAAAGREAVAEDRRDGRRAARAAQRSGARPVHGPGAARAGSGGGALPRGGRSFKGQIGKPILPGFLTILDDPTLAQFGGVSLNGVYKYDDQGVRAQRTTLVDRGVLKTFLLSRAPVAGFSRSNGHGRSSPGRDPVARMANLIVQSDRTLSPAKLKEALIAEARRQEKPFGLLIRDVTGGNTDTSGYAYQAFKGQPRLVYKVDAKTGEETLVRGVEIVGTPLLSINKIIATGDDPRVFNGYCGAESGFVPVSTVAPTILVSEIELQRSRKDSGRSPVLSSPWATPPVTAVKQR